MTTILVFFLAFLIVLIQLPALKFGPGWITAKTVIPESVFLFILVCVFCYLSAKLKKTDRGGRFFIGIILALFILAVLAFSLEYSHFDNYFFSAFHLIPAYIALLAGTLLALYVIFRGNLKKFGLIGLIALFYAIRAGTAGLTDIFGKSLANIPVTIAGAGKSVSDKFITVYGPDYGFITFINSETGPGSRFLIPPNTLPWRHTGDYFLMQSFLYPRSVTTATQTWILNTKNLSDFDYIVISSEEDGGSGDSPAIWPDFVIDAQKIIIYDFASGTPQVYTDISYNPKYWSDHKAWGLIVPKKI